MGNARNTILVLLLGLILGLPMTSAAEEFDARVPLVRAASGNYYVDATFGNIGGTSGRMLVDTGAGIVTVNAKLFDAIRNTAKVTPAGRIAMRMANGRTQAINTYHVDRLRIGEHCTVDDVEIAVLGKHGGNILGLNVLSRLAPFAMRFEPDQLVLSSCSAPAMMPLAAR